MAMPLVSEYESCQTTPHQTEQQRGAFLEQQERPPRSPPVSSPILKMQRSERQRPSAHLRDGGMAGPGRRLGHEGSTAPSESPDRSPTTLSSIVPTEHSSSAAVNVPSPQSGCINDFANVEARDVAEAVRLSHETTHPKASLIFNEGEDDRTGGLGRCALEEECNSRWILNLTRPGRRGSDCEKFWFTYVEKPNLWRRITVSLDYRKSLPGSLEAIVSTLCDKREKGLCIFKEIYDSLDDIQFCDTVTNLKLETLKPGSRPHIHVRVDVEETIKFPGISMFGHIRCPRFNEGILTFDSHLSRFAYKVRLGARVVVKKEIPDPNSIDEFLFQVNALNSQIGSPNVVQLEGIVTDDLGKLVKGLLISFVSQGSLADMIHQLANSDESSWYLKERWAEQIATGLSHIHDAGFVQGDLTLSNIMIDDRGDAQITDINQMGCPFGWAPPELAKIIGSGQHIRMCISVKTDIFQLGMVFWALAEQDGKPEEGGKPLQPLSDSVPTYFRNMTMTCLSSEPQERVSAKDLLRLFPDRSDSADVRLFKD